MSSLALKMEQRLTMENPRFYYLMAAEAVITTEVCLYIFKGKIITVI